MALPETPESAQVASKKAEEQKQPERPTAERRFVAKSVNAFVQWMPLGGSGAAFASFCLHQNWAQALMMFPVTAVTGIWAAYSKNFVEQLQEIYAERGKVDANQFVSLLDSLNETAKWRLAGTDEQYLKLVAGNCRDYTTEGFRPAGSTPLLEDVFVPLQLSNELLRGPDGLALPMRPSLHKKRGGTAEADDDKAVERELQRLEQEGILIWELLREVRRVPAYRQLAILAWGGYGKTTLMRHLTYTFATRRHRKHQVPRLMPFLILLRSWRELLTQESPPSLPDLITQHYIPNLPKGKSLQLPPNWAEQILIKGDALVMFDGFDEVPEGKREGVSRWISQQMAEYDSSVFILTSRPGGYAHYSAEKPRSEVRVKPFSKDQRERFVRDWYRCQERYRLPGRKQAEVELSAQQEAADLLQQIEQRQELQEMAQNPLLLNMIATFHKSFPGTKLPRRRVELYREICQLQLGGRPLARQIELVLPQQESQEILQGLALRMTELNQPAMPREGVLALLQAQPKVQDENLNGSKFLDQVVQVSELLVEKDTEVYEFLHLSFQAYLAASQVVKQQQETLLIDHWLEDWWRETILLYAAQVNPCGLVCRACDRQGAEAAALGYDVLYESLREIEPGLQERVNELRYAKLEALLAAQDWRKADEETYRLMIQTVGKTFGQWFSVRDLQTFPCWDLRRLDELWVRYSEGKWGFSVQKRIWQECGSPGPYDQKTEAQWELFGDRVGWRKDGNWLNYNDFSLLVLESYLLVLESYLGLYRRVV
ncbi:MAG: NACHT domain-containing protein [Synechococcales cyanobacterium CRU_2_2]|nr:NACHT domain-containing protein [Synechococcales cyanobacterium CRU_2_2]